jgi:hypothetical protein
MGSWVSFLVKNVIPSLYYDALGLDPKQEIPLYIFENNTHLKKFNKDGFQSSTVSSMGGTYMKPTVERVANDLQELPEGSTVRVLVISDGAVFDQEKSLEAASAAVAGLSTRGFTVLSQAVRLFTSSYADPDTRALASLMQWDNAGQPSLIEVNPYQTIPITEEMKQFEPTSGLIGRVPMSTPAATGVLMKIVSSVVAAFEGLSSSVPMLTIEHNKDSEDDAPRVMRMPWAPAANKMRMRKDELTGADISFWASGAFDPAHVRVTIGSVPVTVERHTQLTADVYERLIKSQSGACLTQAALLQVVGTAASREQLQKLAKLFTRIEVALNLIAEAAPIGDGSVTADQRSRLRRLHALADLMHQKSRGLSVRLAQMANDNKVAQLNSAQAADYLRSVGTGRAGKALARRAAMGDGDDEEVVRAEVKAVCEHISELAGVDDEAWGVSFVSQCSTAEGLRALAEWYAEPHNAEMLDSMPLHEVLELVPIVGVAMAGPRGDYPDPYTYKATEVHSCSVCASDILQARRFNAVLRAPGQGSSGRAVTSSAEELTRPVHHEQDEYSAGDVTACAPTLHPTVLAFLNTRAPRTQALLASISMRAAMVNIPQTTDALTAAALTSLCVLVSSGAARSEVTAGTITRLIAMRAADRLGADMALFRQKPTPAPFVDTTTPPAESDLFSAAADADGMPMSAWVGDMPLAKLLSALAVKGLKEAQAETAGKRPADAGMSPADAGMSPADAGMSPGVAAVMRAGAVRAAFQSAAVFFPHVEAALTLHNNGTTHTELSRGVDAMTYGFLQSRLCEADLEALKQRLAPLFHDDGFPVAEGAERRRGKRRAKKQRAEEAKEDAAVADAEEEADPDALRVDARGAPTFNGWMALVSPVWRRAVDALLWFYTAYAVGRAAGSVEAAAGPEAIAAVQAALKTLPEQGSRGLSVSLPLEEVPGVDTAEIPAAAADMNDGGEDSDYDSGDDSEGGWGAPAPRRNANRAQMMLPTRGMVQGVPKLPLTAVIPFFAAQGRMSAPFVPAALQETLARVGVEDAQTWLLWVALRTASESYPASGCFPDYVKAYIEETKALKAQAGDENAPVHVNDMSFMAKNGLNSALADPCSRFQLRLGVNGTVAIVSRSCMQRVLGAKARQEEELLGSVIADVVVRGTAAEAASALRDGVPRHSQAFVKVVDGAAQPVEDLLQAWRDSRGVSVAEANGDRCPDGQGAECVFRWRNGGSLGAKTAWMRLLSPEGDGQGRLDLDRLKAKTSKEDMEAYSRAHPVTGGSVDKVPERWAKVQMMLMAVDDKGEAVWNRGAPLRDLDVERGRRYWCGEPQEYRERWMSLYKTWKAASGGNKTDGPRKRKQRN